MKDLINYMEMPKFLTLFFLLCLALVSTASLTSQLTGGSFETQTSSTSQYFVLDGWKSFGVYPDAGYVRYDFNVGGSPAGNCAFTGSVAVDLEGLWTNDFVQEGVKNIDSGRTNTSGTYANHALCFYAWHDGNSNSAGSAASPHKVDWNSSLAVTVVNSSPNTTDLNKCQAMRFTNFYNKFGFLLMPTSGGSSLIAHGLAGFSTQDLSAYNGQTVNICMSYQSNNPAAYWRGYADNVRLTVSNHTVSVTEPAEPVDSFTTFSIRANVTDVNGSNITGQADLNILFNGTYYDMAWNGSYYNTNFVGGFNEGTYPYTVQSKWEGIDVNTTGSIIIERPEYQYLGFTPIENISSWSFGSIDITPDDESAKIIFRVDSNSAFSQSPIFNIFNSLIDGRQYFVYTSSDGNTYTFNDTLTFGSTEYNPVQKIWDQNNERYIYSFTDTLAALETKYYKLTYRAPFKHWFTVSDSNGEWANNLEPLVISDFNTITYDSFSISNYSNIRSIYTTQLPYVSGSETSSYELQFTAWADVNNTVISAGRTVLGTDTVTNVNLTSTPRRYSFTVSAATLADLENTFALIKTNNSTATNVYVTDYALVPRGYFTERMLINKSNGDALDSFLLGGYSKQYLQEGKPFRISTKAYDREGILQTLVLEAFLDGNADSNRVYRNGNQLYGVGDAKEAERLFEFNESFPAVIDLNGNATNPATPRTVFIKATLIDDNNQQIATQSANRVFLQYPYFPSDLLMSFLPTEKRKGKNPAGILDVEIDREDTLVGFEFRIYSDTNTYANPNYQKTIYKDRDFTCTQGICSLNILFDDFVFEDVNKTIISVQALLNTEYKDPNNLLTRIERIIFVTPITFDGAKILQVTERPTNVYRSDEEIPVVLVVHDSESTDVTNKLQVRLRLQNCDGNSSPNCVTQTTQYVPTGVLYDPTTSNTFYFFRQLFLLDNGSLLPDGNYISFVATITDQTGARATINPVLTSRCNNNNIDPAFGLAIGMLKLLTLNVYGGITQTVASQVCTDGVTPSVVSQQLNQTQQQYLRINNSYVRSAPSLQGKTIACLPPNQNSRMGLSNKSLNQKILCAVRYDTGEIPIDAFRFRISNGFSDFKLTGSDRQYYEVTLPYEALAYNDVRLINAELDGSTTTFTFGEMLFNVFNRFAPEDLDQRNIATSPDLWDALTFAIGSDVNQDELFTAESTEGWFFFAVDKLNVVNANNYSNDLRIDNFDEIPRKKFIKYLNENSIGVLPKDKITTTFLIDSTNPSYSTTSEDVLLVDEIPSKSQEIDTNTNTPNGNQLPDAILFDLTTTMFYNNFLDSQNWKNVLTYYVVVKDTPTNAAFGLINDAINDPLGTAIDFVFSNILLITILLMFFVIVAYINRPK